jgi:hypothetical protein
MHIRPARQLVVFADPSSHFFGNPFPEKHLTPIRPPADWLCFYRHLVFLEVCTAHRLLGRQIGFAGRSAHLENWLSFGSALVSLQYCNFDPVVAFLRAFLVSCLAQW